MLRLYVGRLFDALCAWNSVTAHFLTFFNPSTFKEIFMKRFAAALITIGTLCAPAFAEDPATPKDAEALVGKVIKALVADKTGTFKEITAKNPSWVRNNIYTLILDSTGVILAHGGNEKMVGINSIELVDADGKPFGREVIEATMAKGKAWIDFKFGDPVTKKVVPKSIYCEKLSNMAACAVIYKR